MADYVLKVMTYRGIAAGARHWRGKVQGEFARSCHGGTIMSKGKWTCSEGHPLPDRADWNVEAAWTEARYERLAARHFEGDGPAQFDEPRQVIRAALRRFRGEVPHQWWEDEFTPGQPGDRLFLGHVPHEDEDIDPDDTDGPGLPPWGSLLAEIGPGRPLSTAERGLLRHHLQVLSERSKMVRDALGQESLPVTTVSWRSQYQTLIADLGSVTEALCGAVAADMSLVAPPAPEEAHYPLEGPLSHLKASD